MEYFYMAFGQFYFKIMTMKNELKVQDLDFLKILILREKGAPRWIFFWLYS